MIRVDAGAWPDGEMAYAIICDVCSDWSHDFTEETNIHHLNDIALRHEASVEHLLRVMGSDR